MSGNIQSGPVVQSEFEKVQGYAVGTQIFRIKTYYKVRLVDSMARIMWAQNFMKAPRYDVFQKKCIRIIMVQSGLRRSVGNPLGSALGISTLGIFCE